MDRCELARKASAVLGAGILGLLIGAAPAGATSTAPTGPAETQCVRGENAGAGESATNKTPYDPNTITVGIHQAKLSHQSSPNHITMEIVVRNVDKSPTCAAYPVYLTYNQPGGEPQDAPGCGDESFNDPAVPRGTYHCTGIIDGPGRWQFTATVNKPATAGSVQQPIKTAEVILNFPDVPKLGNESKGIQFAVQGKTFEVFLLQFHVAMAGLWMLLAAVMAFLAIPRLRRLLSALVVHTLEVRRGFLTSSLWATFGGTLITGLYLLGTQTAYQAPFSTKKFSFSDWDKITGLPYAQTYFLLLYGKILMFGVMTVASVILMLEANRQAQLAQDADPFARDDDDDMWSKNVHFDSEGHILHDDDMAVAGGATATVSRTAVRARPRAGSAGVSEQTLIICALVLVGGAMAIGVAVTGLKYLHELIETASAHATLLSYKR